MEDKKEIAQPISLSLEPAPEDRLLLNYDPSRPDQPGHFVITGSCS